MRDLARARRVAEDPGCHILQHGYRLHHVILALENCFRIQPDRRVHGTGLRAEAYRADCHYFRGDAMRVDFNLSQAPDGEVILVVTAFLLK